MTDAIEYAEQNREPFLDELKQLLQEVGAIGRA
jgi:hypothetical protein